MPPARHELVYSLLTVVFVLILGIAGLLWVAYNRHQHLADQTLELRHSLEQQSGQITNLKERLERCDSAGTRFAGDTSWNKPRSNNGW